MTNEEFTEEILYKSHSLGILDNLYKCAKELREQDRTLDFNGSIEQAYYKLTK